MKNIRHPERSEGSRRIGTFHPIVEYGEGPSGSFVPLCFTQDDVMLSTSYLTGEGRTVSVDTL